MAVACLPRYASSRSVLDGTKWTSNESDGTRLPRSQMLTTWLLLLTVGKFELFVGVLGPLHHHHFPAPIMTSCALSIVFLSITRQHLDLIRGSGLGTANMNTHDFLHLRSIHGIDQDTLVRRGLIALTLLFLASLLVVSFYMIWESLHEGENHQVSPPSAQSSSE